MDLVGFNATITELTRLGQIDILNINNQDDFEMYEFGRAVDEAYKKGGSPVAKSAANQVYCCKKEEDMPRSSVPRESSPGQCQPKRETC
jgi:hypothetical protein